ncbi:hypothetical protein KY319_04130, partial [Candidatus Woesearchaeota archaeon]|nr:hypothetical protein [Candidatus Woesearchaeota archaeon]
MGYKTYLVMYFGTKGFTATEVAKKLEDAGFETNFGPFDFVYDWKEKVPTKNEVLALGDKVAESLKDSGAVFNLDTH